MGLTLFNTFSSDGEEGTECPFSISAGDTIVGKLAEANARAPSRKTSKSSRKELTKTAVRTHMKLHTEAGLPHVSAAA